jgi:hypothetical protein
MKARKATKTVSAAAKTKEYCVACEKHHTDSSWHGRKFNKYCHAVYLKSYTLRRASNFGFSPALPHGLHLLLGQKDNLDHSPLCTNYLLYAFALDVLGARIGFGESLPWGRCGSTQASF